MVVDAAETAPASWWKRMPPCGVCGTSGADRVGQNVWGRQGHATGDGSWGEESGQHVWDGQGHAIGGGCCGEAIGQRMWDRQTHAIGDGSCGWGYWAGVGQTIGDGSWGDVTGWCVWDNMSYANPCPPHACFHHLPCPGPFQNTARCACCQFQCFPTCVDSAAFPDASCLQKAEKLAGASAC